MSVLRLWLVLDTAVNSNTVVSGIIVLMHRYICGLSVAGRCKPWFPDDKISTLEYLDRVTTRICQVQTFRLRSAYQPN
jgi:hypothetical protein